MRKLICLLLLLPSISFGLTITAGAPNASAVKLTVNPTQASAALGFVGDFGTTNPLDPGESFRVKYYNSAGVLLGQDTFTNDLDKDILNCNCTYTELNGTFSAGGYAEVEMLIGSIALGDSFVQGYTNTGGSGTIQNMASTQTLIVTVEPPDPNAPEGSYWNITPDVWPFTQDPSTLGYIDPFNPPAVGDYYEPPLTSTGQTYWGGPAGTPYRPRIKRFPFDNGAPELVGVCADIGTATDVVVTMDAVNLKTLNQALASAVATAGGNSSTRGIKIVVPWNLDTVQCDSIYAPIAKRTRGPLTISGTVGPNGELPRFYCRGAPYIGPIGMGGNGGQPNADGTIPKKDFTPKGGIAKAEGVEGEWGIFGNPSNPATDNIKTMVENIHIDGYTVNMYEDGHFVFRSNYIHSSPGDLLVFSAVEDLTYNLLVEICGNEISNGGQGNTVHNLYMHRIEKGDGGMPPPHIPTNTGWAKINFIDNVCHTANYSHCYKSIANENIIRFNEFYGSIKPVQEQYKNFSSEPINAATCAINVIEDNYIESWKENATDNGEFVIRLPARRGIAGCDIAHVWNGDHKGCATSTPPELWATECVPPTKNDGLYWTPEYWSGLAGAKLFTTSIKRNTIKTAGPYASKKWAISTAGTYPAFQTNLGGDSCQLPVPAGYYERSVVDVSENTYIGFKSNQIYQVETTEHNGRGNCDKFYGGVPPPAPVPGPSQAVGDYYNIGSGETFLEVAP